MSWSFYDTQKIIENVGRRVNRNATLPCMKVPDSCKELLMIPFQHLQSFEMPNTVSVNYEELDYEIDEDKKDTIVVCISGGINSLATVFFYLDSGNDNIVLFNVDRGKKLNKADILAERLNLPYFQVKRTFGSGSPFRTIEVIGEAIKFCVDHHYPLTIALGCMYGCSLDMNTFEAYGHNSEEMMQAYIKAMKPILGNKLKLKRPFTKQVFVWETMMKHRSYLDMIDCDKSMLYIIRSDYGLIESERPVYLRSVARLKKVHKKMTGHDYKDKYDFWQSCFFYNIRKSKYYDSL